MRKFLQKLNKVKKGLNLVEIIVAIGVSSIALTTSAVFSTRLIYKSQENFMAESSSQFQNVIVEQLRLVESDMIAAKKLRQAGTATARPAAFPLTGTTDTWTRVCNVGTTQRLHYSMDFPQVVNSDQPNFKVIMTEQPASSPIAELGGQAFTFTPVPQNQLTGAFANLQNTSDVVAVAIRRSEVASSTIGNTLVFEVLIRYYVLNKAEPTYSEITTVRMVKDLVCL